MGNLPVARVTQNITFQCSGVDYARLIAMRMTKHSVKGTCKGNIALFIRFSTRAVHLEPVQEYTAEAFIVAF